MLVLVSAGKFTVAQKACTIFGFKATIVRTNESDLA